MAGPRNPHGFYQPLDDSSSDAGNIDSTMNGNISILLNRDQLVEKFADTMESFKKNHRLSFMGDKETKSYEVAKVCLENLKKASDLEEVITAIENFFASEKGHWNDESLKMQILTEIFGFQPSVRAAIEDKLEGSREKLYDEKDEYIQSLLITAQRIAENTPAKNTFKK